MNKSMSFLLACSFSQAKQVYFCVQERREKRGITQNAIFLQEVGKYKEGRRKLTTTTVVATTTATVCPGGKSKNPLLFLWASNAEWKEIRNEMSSY